ncbi:Hok/Gef family protein [Escherichia coli]|nr:Hok/Gef family protein [Escherichia coli]EFP1538404.1 Hok/Gef family protein [Escherichia coli]EFS2878397.1 Hok/Gef family protein [Escherichia coli]EGR8405613.1 Hok/Gef family protein [Escherichia coli]ELL6554482.1 Hok/Gef family protein [Escherichia coli]
MPQKTIIVGMLCLTMLLTVWVLHVSPCEFRVRFMWLEIAAFLQCKP